MNLTPLLQNDTTVYSPKCQTREASQKKKSPNFVAGHHVVHFYFLQNQDLFQNLSTEM
jgi:hypothetical protein